MNKMNRPEMDVVRFIESDVIVASTGVLRISNFADYDSGNGMMNYKGVDYTYNNYSALGQALNRKTTIQTTESGYEYSYSTIFINEHEGGQVMEGVQTADGDYYWRNGAWRMQ